jgi:hypothetical protein
VIAVTVSTERTLAPGDAEMRIAHIYDACHSGETGGGQKRVGARIAARTAAVYGGVAV